MTHHHPAGTVAAVDLGATSGRVILGHVGSRELSITTVARFANGPLAINENSRPALHWNIVELYRNVIAGLGAAIAAAPETQSIGVDSWAVDYALMRGGRMLQLPYHYRDTRTLTAADQTHAHLGITGFSRADLYATNGLQFLPFNSLYQLGADRAAGALDGADQLLLVPDLLNYWLTGSAVAERTNASTTGLLNVHSREWDNDLITRLGLPRTLFAPLVEAGTGLGTVLPAVAHEIRSRGTLAVTAVGSHDTASAVVAVPSDADDFAYISCGTWALVGVELDSPVLTEQARLANFTNEGGVDQRVRFLHNVMGLWLLSESVRTWERQGMPIDLTELLAQAAAVDDVVAVFDVDDPCFSIPGDMPDRISTYCRERGLPVPRTPAEFTRSILESLAEAFARGVAQAGDLSGRSISVIHLLGGGSQNQLLCQLTATRSGLPVLAGPVEATAIGNVLVQARTAGLVSGSLESLRSLVAHSFEPRRYEPARSLAR